MSQDHDHQKYQPRVRIWNRPPLEAAAIGAEVCAQCDYIVVKLETEAGSVFAQGHLDVEMAQRLYDFLGAALVKKRGKPRKGQH